MTRYGFRLLVGFSLLLMLTSCKGKVAGTVDISAVSFQGTEITVNVQASNTGGGAHKFPIGCSVQRADGSWDDIPYQVQDIAAGGSTSLVFKKSVGEKSKFRLVRVSIWQKEKGNGQLDGRLGNAERPVN